MEFGVTYYSGTNKLTLAGLGGIDTDTLLTSAKEITVFNLKSRTYRK